MHNEIICLKNSLTEEKHLVACQSLEINELKSRVGILENGLNADREVNSSTFEQMIKNL